MKTAKLPQNFQVAVGAATGRMRMIHLGKLGGLPVLALGIVLLITGGSAAAFTANEDLRNVVVSKASELVGIKEETKDVEQASSDETPALAADDKDDVANDPSVMKYPTSGDPRSTSYSLTPPKPNPKAVDIRITRPGQVAVGTLIAYAPDKQGQDKTYYGGDLIINPVPLTFSLSSPAKMPFTVSTPGGVTAGQPMAPWYDPGGEFFVAYDSAAYDGPGSSWDMLIDKGWVAASAGKTYTVHITTGSEKSVSETIQYDGFVTINVVP